MSHRPGRLYKKLRWKRLTHELIGSPKYSRPALHELDSKLAKHLTKRGGVFIEAGANDGYNQSNTYYFERMRGWSGVLIEPVPALAEHCRRIRKRSKVFSCALVGPEHDGEMLPIHVAGLMTTVEGALGDSDKQAEHLRRASELQSLDDTPRIEVPCRQMSDVLDEAGVSSIDLLSLDVEGYEPQALSGLDFDRHAPEWICIEMNHREEIERILNDRYEIAEELTERDRLYRRRDA